MTQARATNPYVALQDDREFECQTDPETQKPKLCSTRLVNFFQATLWCLAGSTLVGFAVSVLWWEPICQRPNAANSILEPYNSTFSTVYEWTKKQQEEEEECNPFQQKGYLHYNATDPGDNIWKPYRSNCKPSNLFEQLKQNLHSTQASVDDTENDAFKWLRNRTVVLIGDSIDRYHNVDFCNVLSWELGSTEQNPIISGSRPTRTYHVGADSPLSAPPWHFYPEDPTKPPEDWPKEESELFKNRTSVWDAGLINANVTRPRVCEIPKYGFTMISLFNWGLDPKEGGRLYAEIAGYYPPAEYTSRIQNILKPLLENVSKKLNNPLIMKPDLIEMSSGYWDLRQWSEEDIKIANKERTNPPLSYDIGFDDLAQDRLDWWTERQKKAIKFVSNTFPQDQTPILWRSLHHVQAHYWVGFSRVDQIDQLARYNIEIVKQSDPTLESRLRVDEWGALMLGQEHRFRDAMHVKELPGGVLWGDIMLWELRRAVRKRGFSYYTP